MSRTDLAWQDARLLHSVHQPSRFGGHYFVIFFYYSHSNFQNNLAGLNKRQPRVRRLGNFPLMMLGQMARYQRPAERCSLPGSFIHWVSFRTTRLPALDCLVFSFSLSFFSLNPIKTGSRSWLTAALLCRLSVWMSVCETSIYSCNQLCPKNFH